MPREKLYFTWPCGLFSLSVTVESERICTSFVAGAPWAILRGNLDERAHQATNGICDSFAAFVWTTQLSKHDEVIDIITNARPRISIENVHDTAVLQR